MAIARIQKLVTLTCLCFIGLFFIMGALPISQYSLNSGVGSQPRNPSTAFGETPFDVDPLLKESGFDAGIWWNYTPSANLNVSRDPVLNRGNFNHSSIPVVVRSPVIITSADYKGDDETATVNTTDNIKLKLTEVILDVHYIFNVYFPVDFNTGDIITMRFTSGSNCTIRVRGNGTREDPIYGFGMYGGGVADVNISLGGSMSAPRRGFNLDVDFTSYTQNAWVDQVSGWWTSIMTDFTAHAYINQTITTPNDYDVVYALACTGNVSVSQNIQVANLAVQINETNIWSQNIVGVAPDTRFSIQMPHGLLQAGGDFRLVFHLTLIVNSSAPAYFLMFIDDVYLNRTPSTNLLDDSQCITGTPWQNKSFGQNYSSSFNTINQFWQAWATNATTVGGANFSQTFSTNSSRSNYSLVLNYYVGYMINIEHMNITVAYNDVVFGSLTNINQTTMGWAQFRVNATLLTTHQIYVLNITLSAKPSGALPSVWGCAIDNIYLYPNWGSNLTRLGGAWDPNIGAGEIKEVLYQYNMSGNIRVINDANVTVYDNDTGKVWGDGSKFQVTNYGNGTYLVAISTVGLSAGTFHLFVVFYRANFPDMGSNLTLIIAGEPLNVTFSAGAHFNDVDQIWYVNEENLPYVDDNSKVITIYVFDDSTKSAITNGFVEAVFYDKTLAWMENYKRSGNPADKGYYDIYLNTTGVPTFTEYCLLNFSVRVTAQGYSATTEKVTTKVLPLPSIIAVPDIEPFYEGGTLTLQAIFQDTFHGTGIDDGNLTWTVLGQPFAGNLEFIFLGFYESELQLQDLDPGNYTLRINGEKPNYANAVYDQPIEVEPKWNVTLSVTYPANYMEGNSYQVTFNCTYTELGTPLVGEAINFFINYTHEDEQENFNAYTGEDGLITITIMVPLSETELNITASYAGKTNVSVAINSTAIPVIARYAVSLDILTTDFAAELVGETNLEIQARLTYAGGAPIANATLVFRVSTSEVSVITDATGLAIAFVKLPTQGKFYIVVAYAGTSMIKAESKQSEVELNIISPTDAFMNQIIQYAMYIGIIAAIVFGLYIGVSRGVVRPKQRARQAEYVGLMNRFEDARNIQLLMLINRESGTEIYSKALSGVPVDPTLVTGFLQAIMSFGKELISEDKVESMQGPKAYLAKQKAKAQTQILEFHHFKIILEETAHLRIALLLVKNPSQRLLNALHKFSERVETRFGVGVDQLRGRQLSDDDTWELIDDAFEPSLIYVHMTDLVNARSITPTRWEKVVLDEIQRAPFYGEAYLDTLQEQIAHNYIGKELEIVDAGLSLRHKNVLLALSPRYMEVRLTIKKAIDSLPVSAKHVILTIGDGESNAAKIIQKVKIPQTELTSIVQQLQELGIITDKLQLDMAGKLVYTTLKVGAEQLKK